MPSQPARQTGNTKMWLLCSVGLTEHLLSLWYGLIQVSIHLSEQGSSSKTVGLCQAKPHRSAEVLVLGDISFF